MYKRRYVHTMYINVHMCGCKIYYKVMKSFLISRMNCKKIGITRADCDRQVQTTPVQVKRAKYRIININTFYLINEYYFI